MRKWLKRLGLLIGGLVGLAVLLVAGIYVITSVRMRKTYRVAVQAPPIPTDSGTLRRGRHFAIAIGKCADCHGRDFGGNQMNEDFAFGRLWATNLTRGQGGIGHSYTDADWARAIRHGVDRQGKPLLFMPSEVFQAISDADLAAVIAYMRTVPPVNRTVPEPRIGPVARALSLFAGFPLVPAAMIDHDSPSPPAPPPGVNAAYGKYLATVGGCTGCHLADLSGGGGPPPGAPNITPDPQTGIGHWTEADFFRALRTGMRPNRTPIDQTMPWVAAGQMTDAEIRAVWMYLRSVPAKSNPKQPAGGAALASANP